ncbi:MAG: tyrosine-type recombinase/integrase [Bryocella sp.]
MVWKDGKTVTYRYHPVGRKPISLGIDKNAAIRQVLNMNGITPQQLNVSFLWETYHSSADWKALSGNSQESYVQSSKPLLRVFGHVHPASIAPADCARYLRVERRAAPVRANREMALLSNLMNVAVERGDIATNPCKQTRRNKERPRKESPEPETLVAFLAWANAREGQTKILAAMAEFAALTGNRRIEFLELHWPQISASEVRLIRGKQRDKQVVESVGISPALADLLNRLRSLATDDRLGAVFPNRHGNPYTDQGFKAMWSKLVARALKESVIDRRFTFHDLRAYHVTQFKKQTGALPDLHANPATTARVYDRSKIVKRESL